MFTNLSGTDVGDYNVVVSNGNGSAVSAMASVRVLIAPRIRSITRTGTTAQIAFESAAGQRYAIEYRDSLTSGTWNLLQRIDGTSQILTINDPTATGPTRFYQIRVE